MFQELTGPWCKHLDFRAKCIEHVLAQGWPRLSFYDSVFWLQNLKLHNDHHERLMELIQNMTPTTIALVEKTPPNLFFRWLSGLYLLACGKHQEVWRMLQYIVLVIYIYIYTIIYILKRFLHIGQERLKIRSKSQNRSNPHNFTDHDWSCKLQAHQISFPKSIQLSQMWLSN